eukprot:scaffold5181_cov62-Cyclotella_meneghiniana.AAC.4
MAAALGEEPAEGQGSAPPITNHFTFCPRQRSVLLERALEGASSPVSKIHGKLHHHRKTSCCHQLPLSADMAVALAEKSQPMAAKSTKGRICWFWSVGCLLKWVCLIDIDSSTHLYFLMSNNHLCDL